MAERGRRRRITVGELAEVRALEGRVRAAAASAAEALAELGLRGDPLALLRALKFEDVGFDPLEPDRRQSLLDQVHQTHAWLAALRGLEHLLREHPEHAPYHLNLGTPVVPDIESADGAVVAEVWAGISAAGNRKVDTDLARLRTSGAPLRYFFYYAAQPGAAPQADAIRVVAVEL